MPIRREKNKKIIKIKLFELTRIRKHDFLKIYHVKQNQSLKKNPTKKILGPAGFIG